MIHYNYILFNSLFYLLYTINARDTVYNLLQFGRRVYQELHRAPADRVLTLGGDTRQ